MDETRSGMTREKGSLLRIRGRTGVDVGRKGWGLPPMIQSIASFGDSLRRRTDSGTLVAVAKMTRRTKKMAPRRILYSVPEGCKSHRIQRRGGVTTTSVVEGEKPESARSGGRVKRKLKKKEK
jgi:hypothetical protein